MANSATYIPEELVTKILIQLPVKSLLICKSVCKTWLSIISSPYFIKSQLYHALVNPTVLNIRNRAKKSFKAEQKEELLDKSDSSFGRIKSHVMPRLFHDTEIVSSCNGIIFLRGTCPWSHDYGLFLWNPSIRQYKKLPFPKLSVWKYSCLEGFGYDSISDDYKVVRLVYDERPTNFFDTVEVYSSNADSMREFKNPFLKKLKYDERHSIVANGVLYLIGNEDELISFDLNREVLGLVSLPSFDDNKRRSDVMDFQGSLAVLFESGPGIIDLWTLDGVSCHISPWTKKFSIHTGSEIWIHFYLGAKQFYGSRSSNKLTTGFLYDYESKKMRYNGLAGKKVYGTLKCSETLVSLDGFEQVTLKCSETLVSLDVFEQASGVKC